MSNIWNCPVHNRVAELYCKACRHHLCPQCVTAHSIDCYKPSLIHVLDYAPRTIIPALDRLIEKAGEKDSRTNEKVLEFVTKMRSFVPKVKEELKSRMDDVAVTKGLVQQMEKYSAPDNQLLFVDRIRQGLTADKKQLEDALKKRDLLTAARLTMKIEAEEKTSGDEIKDKALISKVKKSVSRLEDLGIYASILSSLQKLNTKCQHLKLNCAITKWQCNRNYLSPKTTLSDDGLILGNKAGNGYPGTIGDVPFEMGVMAFEVTPSGLCCKGKEGFGIIELSKFKARYEHDKSAPVVYEDMIGLLYDNVARNMTVVDGSTLKNNEKYLVKADMYMLKMTITGPNCSIKADLKADTLYVPCFSCGCRFNKMVIRPVEA
eukprot:TRINITY_DN9321_c0_g9_i1.p1 TRINITY_DN9321_c0_g9~~TRINITY_DN9321_c0_g9_i1.p1  ORF type:complete len:376 (-),score=81.74 TRINITY_DN9321_c0_g9_i1:141-1268(-)